MKEEGPHTLRAQACLRAKGKNPRCLAFRVSPAMWATGAVRLTLSMCAGVSGHPCRPDEQ